jgi:hypothetical protein
MQNVGMNIADKPGSHGDLQSLEGRRYAFQEIAAGESPPSYFPLPWATEPADIFRSLRGDSRTPGRQRILRTRAILIEHCGKRPTESVDAGRFVVNLTLKCSGTRRSLAEHQVRLVRGVFRAK